MIRSHLCSCLLFLLLTGILSGEEKPFPAETELQAQTRRRELLHQQLRELLASSDPDVQQLGILFHALGKYDPAELLPLLEEPDGSAETAIVMLLQSPRIPESVLDRLTELLGENTEFEWLDLVRVLDRYAPTWRERQATQEVIQNLLAQLVSDDERAPWTVAKLQALRPQIAGQLPGLLILLQFPWDAETVSHLAQVIPWDSLGEHQDRAVQVMLKLMLRHRSGVLSNAVLGQWSQSRVKLSREELHPLLVQCCEPYPADRVNKDLPQRALTSLVRFLDGQGRDWRTPPPVRELVASLLSRLTDVDLSRQVDALTTLAELGEVNHAEFKQCFLGYFRADRQRARCLVCRSLFTVRFSEAGFNPDEEQQLLRWWIRLLLKASEDASDEALTGLNWMGATAKPAMPLLLLTLERMLSDDAFQEDLPDGSFSRFQMTWDPLSVIRVCDRIDAGWMYSLPGRSVLARFNEMMYQRLGECNVMVDWQEYFWSRCGGTSPELRSLLVRRFLTPDSAGRVPELEIDLGLGSHVIHEVDPLSANISRCDELCPSWPEDPEARELWGRLEPEFPFSGKPVVNRLFVRLTLHHPRLTSRQKRDYLLKLLPRNLVEEPGFCEVLDELDPAWIESPQVRQALPELESHLLIRLAQSNWFQNLNSWVILKRANHVEQVEFPLLMCIWVSGYIRESQSYYQLPQSLEAVEQRLRELDPDYLSSELAVGYRRELLQRMAESYCIMPEIMLSRCRRLGWGQVTVQDSLQQLPGLLTWLARRKESADDKPTPASVLLFQMAFYLRERRILDGPILLPR